MMAGVYGVLRVLQRQQRESYSVLLRLSASCSPLHGRLHHWQARRDGGRQTVQVAGVRQLSTGGQDLPNNNTQLEEKVDVGPGTWQEVYHGILSTQIRMVKTFSLSTTVMGLAMQPVLIQKAADSSVGLVVAMGSFIGFFTFVTPILIHWITKKYVTRLHYDAERDLYSATTLSFFLREKKVEFKVDDIHVPSVPGMFTTFHAKDKPFFVDPRMFRDIEHYGRIMGYDKPIDFKLGEDDKHD